MAGVLLTSGCSATFGKPRAPGWIDVETPHFELKTSLPREQALETAEYLERTRTAMLNAAWGGSKGPPGKVEVVVFARGTQAQRFVSAYAAGETRAPLGFERMIVFSRNASIGMASIGAHELAHQLSAWYMPLQPSWLAEGLASFLETIRVDKATSIAYVGAPPTSRVSALRSDETFDTKSLFAADSPRSQGLSTMHHFYGQSWLLVRYLIEEQQQPFATFQRRLAGMVDWRSAFDYSMPEGLAPGPQLDKRLAAYWEDRKNWVFAATKPVVLETYEPSVRAMSEASIHGMFSWLAFPDLDAAEREMNEALRMDPNDLYALRTQFYLFSRTREGEAVIARQAVSAHPNSAEAWVMACEAAASEAELVQAMERAKRVDKNHPRLQAQIGLGYLRVHNEKAALPHLSYALHRVAPTPDLLAGYVRALVANQRCIDARQIAESTPPRFSDAGIARIRDAYAAVQPACAAQN